MGKNRNKVRNAAVKVGAISEGNGSEDFKIENLSYNLREIIAEGLLILGCIQEIESHRLIIAIPGGLGTVDIFHISRAYTNFIKMLLNSKEENAILSLPSLNEMFKVGDVLCCKILRKYANNSKYQFIMTIDPAAINKDIPIGELPNSLVLNCMIEDLNNSLVALDAGIGVTIDPIKREEFDTFLKTRKGKTLHVGMVLSCATTCSKHREDNRHWVTVTVAVDPKQVAAAELSSNWQLNKIPPGSKLTANIAELLPRVITLDASIGCQVIVPSLHLKTRWDKISNSSYNLGTEVKGRILFYHPKLNVLFASLQTNLVEKYYKTTYKVSPDSIIERAKVVDINQDTAYMKFAAGPTWAVKMFRGITKVSQQRFGKVNPIDVESEHKCKILHVNSMDDAIALSVAEEIITVHDLKCGDFVRGTIKVLNKVAVVEISKKLDGLLDRTQLFNYPGTPELGQVITCRVLSVDRDKTQIFLSCNPKILESKQSVIDNYDTVKNGQTTHGTIIGFQNQRVAVMLYNNIRAEVDVTNIIEPPKKAVTCFFRLGDVVKCTVTGYDSRNQKLYLEIQKKKYSLDRVGQINDCKVVRVEEDGLHVQLIGQENPSLEKHFLPLMHLSDQSQLCDCLLKSYNVGDEICNVVFIAKGIVSRKASLVNWYATNNGLDYDSFQIGSCYPAYVGRFCEGTGLFVNLPDGYVGFNNQIKFLTGNENILMENATIFVKVTGWPQQSHHILFDIERNINLTVEVRLNYLEIYVADLHHICAQVKIGNIKVGDEVTFKATSMKIALIMGKVKGHNAVLYKNQIGDVKIHVGQSYRATVIHLDPVNCNIEVSTCVTLSGSETKTQLAESTSVSCTCVLVKNDFLLATVDGNYSPRLIYLPGSKYANCNELNIEDFKIGCRLGVKIMSIMENYSIGLHSGSGDATTKNSSKRRLLNELFEGGELKRIKTLHSD